MRNLPPIETRFKPGQSGNPGGRAKGARVRLQGAFLNALADDFDNHGKRAIERCREEDPVAYVRAVAQLMPKQVEQHNPLDDLNDADLLDAIAFLRARLAEAAGAGADTAH